MMKKNNFIVRESGIIKVLLYFNFVCLIGFHFIIQNVLLSITFIINIIFLGTYLIIHNYSHRFYNSNNLFSKLNDVVGNLNG